MVIREMHRYSLFDSLQYLFLLLLLLIERIEALCIHNKKNGISKDAPISTIMSIAPFIYPVIERVSWHWINVKTRWEKKMIKYIDNENLYQYY